MRLARTAAALWLFTAAVAFAQTPQPFPRPSAPQTAQPQPAPPQPVARPQQPAPPAASATNQQPSTAAAPPPRPSGATAEPDSATLGVPLYPSAQFISSYDAGRGQRYYLYGTAGSFADLVTYYRTQLRDRGSLVFDEPPTHSFEVGRFRDETMAFPPGVTVRDWTWGGSQGYPNPKGQPARFPTVLMIVPPPAGTPPAAR